MTYDLQNRNLDNATIINSNYTSKKTDTRKIIFASNLFAKYKIQLEIISLIDIKQHNKINKTEFRLSNIISDEKNNAILFSFDFISKFFHSIVEQYYIIIVGLFIIKNNERDECEQTLQYFWIIKMFRKNIFNKSYISIQSHSLFVDRDTMLILTKKNFNGNEFVNSSINDINKIHNIYFKLEKNIEKEFYLALYLFFEAISVCFPLFIIIDNINAAQSLKKFVRGEERRREEKGGEGRRREEKRGEERRIFFLLGNKRGQRKITILEAKMAFLSQIML